ncbi:hypothetical protein D3879_07720 [Pseudomonas cavernicola]|uniref:Uncharacterized protein n=1 Tax=Pseudomonas cavernicola TaxID=2320866 RepID=A0A418XKY6_9PSED|nr:hypothetical protein D3879_07720 [Pseudomonas cavernicola]
MPAFAEALSAIELQALVQAGKRLAPTLTAAA